MTNISVRLMAAALFGCVTSYAAAHAESSFGRAVFATLDDSDSRLRGYGWNAIEDLGRVSGANQLQTLRFETFLGDGTGLRERIVGLMKRARSRLGTEKSADANDSTKAADPETTQFTQIAKAVPEIAALAAITPDIDKTVSAEDLKTIKAASTRQRPRIRLFMSAASGFRQWSRISSRSCVNG